MDILVCVVVCASASMSSGCIFLARREPPRSEVVERAGLNSQVEIAGPYTRLRGNALPAYAVVETFFDSASDALNAGPGLWQGFLQQLRIRPGSRAEAVLEAAILRARDCELVASPDQPPPRGAGQAPIAIEDLIDQSRRRLPHLASIYASLLLDLAERGYPIQRICAYLQRSVRPGISMTIVSNPESPVNVLALILEQERKFEQLFIEALAARAARYGADEGR